MQTVETKAKQTLKAKGSNNNKEHSKIPVIKLLLKVDSETMIKSLINYPSLNFIVLFIKVCY